jgi:CBS domain-containing protein
MVLDAIQLMDEKNVGAVPVVDNGTLVGILSELDYIRKVILKGRSSKETPVSDIMTAQLVTVNRSDSVTECMRIMTETLVWFTLDPKTHYEIPLVYELNESLRPVARYYLGDSPVAAEAQKDLEYVVQTSGSMPNQRTPASCNSVKKRRLV